MNKMGQVMFNFIKVIFLILIGYLLILSMFSTSYLSSIGGEFGEFTYYRSDSPLWHLFMLAVLTIACMAIKRLCPNIWQISTKMQKLVSFVVLGILFLWIAVTLLLPGADQYFCVDTALAFCNHDYSAMESGGYLDIYPNQIGLVLLEMPMVRIFGRSASLMFEMFNGMCLLLIYWFTKKMTEIAFDAENNAGCTYYSIMLYLPLSFYIIFVYGTIPGMAASFGGFWLLMRYLKKRQMKDMFWAVILLVLANVLKNNYLIAILAAIAILFLDVVCFEKEASKENLNKSSRFISLAGIVLLIFLYLLSGWAVQKTAKAITGIAPGSGIPKQAWLAMGLQESENRAQGWYNGYNWNVYEENGYDTELTKVASEQSIQESMTYFKEHPAYAMQFFGKKIASQWNNPTFQCFWIYLSRQTKSPIISKTLPIARGNNRWLVSIFNIIQTWILVGTLFYLIYHWKNIGTLQLLIPVFFIGGFLFHLVWEAKAQYTLPYFVMLFPLAVAGLREFITDIENAAKKRTFRCKACAIIVTLAIISVATAIPTFASQSLFTIEQDSELYHTTQWN